MAVLTERMRIALAMIAHVQIVVEKMVGQHGGEQRRRQAIMYLEMLKAVSRLVLLACTREMVIGGGAVSSFGLDPRLRSVMAPTFISRSWRGCHLLRKVVGCISPLEVVHASCPPLPTATATPLHTGWCFISVGIAPPPEVFEQKI